MKRIILLGLSHILLLGISSCQKKELINPSSSESKEITQTKTNFNLRIWYDNGGKDYGCWLAGGNCLDDVIVTPWLANNITDFSASSDQRTFAIANYATLSEVIDKKLLDQIITRNLKVSMRGEITATEIGYLIFKSASGNQIQSVHPFRQ